VALVAAPLELARTVSDRMSKVNQARCGQNPHDIFDKSWLLAKSESVGLGLHLSDTALGLIGSQATDADCSGSKPLKSGGFLEAR